MKDYHWVWWWVCQQGSTIVGSSKIWWWLWFGRWWAFSKFCHQRHILKHIKQMLSRVAADKYVSMPSCFHTWIFSKQKKKKTTWKNACLSKCRIKFLINICFICNTTLIYIMIKQKFVSGMSNKIRRIWPALRGEKIVSYFLSYRILLLSTSSSTEKLVVDHS